MVYPDLIFFHGVQGPFSNAHLIPKLDWLVFLFSIFPYIGNDDNPNWRTHIFQRGRYTTNQMVACRAVAGGAIAEQRRVWALVALGGSDVVAICCHGARGPWGCVKPKWGVSPTNIELNYGKIYRKALYLMVKTMVSCNFSLKPIQWNKHGNFNLHKSTNQQPARLMLKQAKLLRWAVGLAICLVIWVITNNIPD